MNEQSQSRPENITEFPTSGVIPAARLMTDFAWERVGDDLILFDGETMQYHTLNGVAERIWRACDGTATLEVIAAFTDLALEVVETTIGELGEAELLQTPASTWSVPMNRRRAAKLIAAGAAGAVGLPVVLSLTAPSHQGAATPGTACTYQFNSLVEATCTLGDSCLYQSDYVIFCCTYTGFGTRIWWTDCGSI